MRVNTDAIHFTAEIHSPSPGYSEACCREEWRGDRAVARESEGGWGFGAIPLKRYPAACCGELHRVSIYFGNHRKVSVPLDVFIVLSSPRGASLQPKIYHVLYHLNLINLTKEAVHLCDRTGVKGSIIPLFIGIATRCGSFDHYHPYFLRFVIVLCTTAVEKQN